jgi:signal transduction histidine kinase
MMPPAEPANVVAPVRWWRRLSLRARLLLLGVAGLCVGLFVGGLAFLAALSFVLQRSVDAEAEHAARDVAALVDAGALPDPLPVAGAERVQVVDAVGRVRSASIEADRLVPMAGEKDRARMLAGEKLFIHGDRVGLVGPVRILAVPAGPPSDPQTVLVARSMSDVLRGVGLLRTTLLVALPLVVVVLSLVAWRVIGAALAPVESLRRGAEDITGTGRAARLPVPDGRDEIHRLAATLNDMLDRLEAGRARQREFVGDAAHELRSPLANMRTQLEVALRLGDSALWPKVAEDLLADTARLGRLVDDLLLLARSDESPRLDRMEPVELGALLREAAARYPTVRLEPADCPLWTIGEPDALRRVVSNVLDNAVRHASSAVVLVAGSDGGDHVVTVTDDGPGIPAVDRGRVFERFTRLDDARGRDAGGAGLGLAIVRELVRRHGGSVFLGDAHPGLRVRIRLPRAPEADLG